MRLAFIQMGLLFRGNKVTASKQAHTLFQYSTAILYCQSCTLVHVSPCTDYGGLTTGAEVLSRPQLVSDIHWP